MARTTSIISLLEEIEYNGETAQNIFVKYKLVEELTGNVRFFDLYTVKENDRWDLISNRVYGTDKLWWVIAMFNKIHDPFQELHTEDTLKIIKPIHLQEILIALRRAIRAK